MSRETTELDLGSHPEARATEVLAAFDALAPGEAVTLVSERELRPLLLRLQAERAGRFEWSVLESGPDRFRVALQRRTAEGSRAVTEYLEGDHRRLDAIVPVVEELLAEGAFADASQRFAEFTCGLDWHIDAEEKVLFPAFERMTGMRSGPTEVMRREHVDIRHLMGDIAVALATQEGDDATRALAELVDLLGGHNMKEERMLYPTADRAAGDAQARDELVRRIQAA